VYTYNFQDMPTTVDIFVNTNFAGCKETRQSTSGGVSLVGKCLVKHWAKTQTTISLSSGESDLHGIASGCAQALGVQSLMRDMGWTVPMTVHSDATAAIGIARRKGRGKIRHLDVTDLWIQDIRKNKQIKLINNLGTENVADVFTNYADRATLEKALANMCVFKLAGRSACAPAAMGV
jgi:hypothetical protein